MDDNARCILMDIAHSQSVCNKMPKALLQDSSQSKGEESDRMDGWEDTMRCSTREIIWTKEKIRDDCPSSRSRGVRRGLRNPCQACSTPINALWRRQGGSIYASYEELFESICSVSILLSSDRGANIARSFPIATGTVSVTTSAPSTVIVRYQTCHLEKDFKHSN